MSKQQYIGFLSMKSVYNRLKNGTKEVPKSVIFREEAARNNNLIPCYFLFSHLSGSQDHITALVNENGVYQEKRIPVPRVIYNLEWTSPIREKIIKRLTQKGIKVFNEINILRKYKFQKILEANPEFHRYLPETKIGNLKNLKEMMQKYTQLILKPDNGIIGKGILKLQKVNKKDWCLSYKAREGKRRYWKEITFQDTIPEMLQQTLENNVYLIQNLLPLATYQGSPFDFRVSTQKNGSGNWEVSAIIGKVAREGTFLTNIEQGASAYTLDELMKEYPHLNADQLRKQITSLAIKIANLYSKHVPHPADLGFDIAITPQGDLYYIECNFISAYSGFTIKNRVLLHEEWKAVFTNPIDYARYLLDNETNSKNK